MARIQTPTSGMNRANPILFLSCLLLLSPWASRLPIFARAGLSIGGGSSTGPCYDALQSSKGDDDRVDKDEYVTMINILSNDDFTSFQNVDGNWGFYPVTDFFTFPKNVQDNFWRLACGGSGNNLNICAEAYLYSGGSASNEEPTDQQTSYLYKVCKETDDAIKEALPKPVATPPTISSGISTPASSSDSSSVITTPPTAPLTAASRDELPFYNGSSYTGPLDIHLSYQIIVGPNIAKSDSMQNLFSPLRSDLGLALRTWLVGVLDERIHNNNSRRIPNRGLRGINNIYNKNNAQKESGMEQQEGASLIDGEFQRSTSRKRSLLVSIADGSEITSAADDADCNAAPGTIEEGDHCMEISHNITLNLIDESNPDEIRDKITSSFDDAVSDGSFLNLIPPTRREDIRAISPSHDNSNDFTVSELPTNAAPSPTPPVTTGGQNDLDILQSILGVNPSSSSSGDGGKKSNTTGIVLGVFVSCFVVVAGFFVIRQRSLWPIRKDSNNKNQKELKMDTLDNNRSGSNNANPFTHDIGADEMERSSSSGKPNPFSRSGPNPFSNGSDDDDDSSLSDSSGPTSIEGGGSGSSSSSSSSGESSSSSEGETLCSEAPSRVTISEQSYIGSVDATSHSEPETTATSDKGTRRISVALPFHQTKSFFKHGSSNGEDQMPVGANSNNAPQAFAGSSGESFSTSDGESSCSEGPSMLTTKEQSYTGSTGATSQSEPATNAASDTGKRRISMFNQINQIKSAFKRNSSNGEERDEQTPVYANSNNEPHSFAGSLKAMNELQSSMLFDNISDSDSSIDDASLQDDLLETMVENHGDSDSDSSSSDDHRQSTMSVDLISSNVDLTSSAIDEDYHEDQTKTHDYHQDQTRTHRIMNNDGDNVVPFSQRPMFDTDYSMDHVDEDDEDDMIMSNFAQSENSPFDDIQSAIESGDWDAIKANAASLSSGQPTSPSAVMVQGEEEHDTIMSKITDHSEHSSQLHDIQSAIDSGDWDAVRANATKLASHSNSSDEVPCEEIDELVNNSNWEGIVAKAAKYAGDVSSTQASTVFSEEYECGSSRSSTASEESRLSEAIPYRAEIEDLVLKVIPDEINNIDDIMIQFSGREEEFIETLRAMQQYHNKK